MALDTIEAANTPSGRAASSRRPRSTPTSSPVSIRQPPRSGTARAHRSASGSLAITRSASTDRASATAASIAPFSSGLGKGTVGKSGSGSACSGTTTGSAKPASTMHRRRSVPPTPCSGVYTTRSAARSSGRRCPDLGHQRAQALDVGVDDVRPDPVVHGGAGDVGQRADGVDRRRDGLVGRWHDLAAVAQIDLVAVVGRRIVRGRHHDPRHGTERADRERHNRCGHVRVEQQWSQGPHRRRSRRCRARTRRTCAARRSRSPPSRRRCRCRRGSGPARRPSAAPPPGSSGSGRRRVRRGGRRCRTRAVG